MQAIFLFFNFKTFIYENIIIIMKINLTNSLKNLKLFATSKKYEVILFSLIFI